MKKILVFLLALCLLAVPVCAEGYLVLDGSGLMESHDVAKLEEVYGQYSAEYGFTPILLTVDSFGGLSAEEFASEYYDVQGYPEDGILLLVSLEEGQWYILTNGECYYRISDREAQSIGEQILPMIRDGSYYAAFLRFPELAAEIYVSAESTQQWEPGLEVDDYEDYESESPKKMKLSTCILIGMLIGLVVTGIMAAMMKTVRQQSGASDYIRPGSMKLTNTRDIFLYSHVSRSPKSSSSSSGGGSRGGGGRSGGGSRGGAGGRI